MTRRFSLAFGVLCTAVAIAARAQLADPLPAEIVPDGLTVRILDWVEVPQSGTPAAAPRINLAYHARDGSGRLFVNDQRGLLYVIVDNEISLYLDLAGARPDFRPDTGYGTGFHSFTFDPEFVSNGRFYTVHLEPPGVAAPDLVSPATVSPSSHSVIVEWTASDSGANVFAGSSRDLLRIEQPTNAHTTQEIGFNPNAVAGDEDYRLLYIGQGDGAGPANVNPQDLISPHGSILRIDPDGNDSGNGAYGLPPGNPWALDGDPDTLAEIWAYGLRNPHRFSWDTGGDRKMLIGDIGQSNIEEINLGFSAANYGWNEREGTFLHDTSASSNVYPLPPDDELLGYSYPVAQYDHDEGNAIVAGFVYRGATIPELQGEYLFGDIVNGRIFHVPVEQLVEGSQATFFELSLVDAQDVPVTMLDLVQDTRVDLRFGIDTGGEILILSKTDGKVRRLVSTLEPDSDDDGEPDITDNCDLVTNPDQRDTDGDGFGNPCDADLNNDGIVNVLDLGLLRVVFLTPDADADFNGDGIVNAIDLGILKTGFFAPPGP